MFTRKETRVPNEHDAHHVLDRPMLSGFTDGTAMLYVAMGCFWGAERIFWKIPGVVSTAVGYMGGSLDHPDYEDVCSGRTGHAETVMIAYDPSVVSAEQLLKAFWENHDPTTRDRQGNDVGTQYRSAIFWTTSEQERAARTTSELFQQALDDAGRGAITTEMRSADDVGPFWPAEMYHQQYLSKNPGGYCNHGPNGLTCPVGVADLPAQTDILPPR